MDDLLESKANVVLQTIKLLSMRTNRIEDFVTRFNNDHEARTSQPISNVIPQIVPSTELTIF